MNETTPADVYKKLAEIQRMLRVVEERRTKNIAETAAVTAVFMLVYVPLIVGGCIYILSEALR